MQQDYGMGFKLYSNYSINLDEIQLICDYKYYHKRFPSSPLTKHNSIVSRLFITHEKDEDDLNRQKYIIIKYSKYLYRIYLILSKIESDDSESYKEMAIKFEEKVIPIRKTYNIKKADSLNIWEITMLGENIEDYVLKIKIKFFEILNNLLSITKIKNKLLEIYTETFKMEF